MKILHNKSIIGLDAMILDRKKDVRLLHDQITDAELLLETSKDALTEKTRRLAEQNMILSGLEMELKYLKTVLRQIAIAQKMHHNDVEQLDKLKERLDTTKANVAKTESQQNNTIDVIEQLECQIASHKADIQMIRAKILADEQQVTMMQNDINWQQSSLYTNDYRPLPPRVAHGGAYHLYIKNKRAYTRPIN
jgi:chromosome segregation ATPase